MMEQDQIQKWKKLLVYEDGFRYKKQDYSFEDIESLEFAWKATKVSVNLVPAGTDNEAYLSISLTGDRKPIHVGYTGSWTKWPSSGTEHKASTTTLQRLK